jgi:hypothetical protein
VCAFVCEYAPVMTDLNCGDRQREMVPVNVCVCVCVCVFMCVCFCVFVCGAFTQVRVGNLAPNCADNTCGGELERHLRNGYGVGK